jgi:hypothetical protein
VKPSASSSNRRWRVLAEVLANTPTGDVLRTEELPSRDAFSGFLARFLKASFDRTGTDEPGVPISGVSDMYFKKSVEELLRAPYRPSQFFHPVKYAALSWANYFAIKILWIQDPKTLITITEQQAERPAAADQKVDAIRLSLVSQGGDRRYIQAAYANLHKPMKFMEIIPHGNPYTSIWARVSEGINVLFANISKKGHNCRHGSASGIPQWPSH